MESDNNKFKSYSNTHWEEEEHTGGILDRLSPPQRKLLRNVMLCAMLALLLWGVKIGETGAENVTETANYAEDETLGRLKYVNGDDVIVTSEDYSLPMAGEVVETFEQNGINVTVTGEDNAKVSAILSGTVSGVSSSGVTITNENGTTTTYEGIVPTVSVGDAVKNDDQIGKLAGEELTLTTMGGIGYMDSLDAGEILGIGG